MNLNYDEMRLVNGKTCNGFYQPASFCHAEIARSDLAARRTRLSSVSLLEKVQNKHCGFI